MTTTTTIREGSVQMQFPADQESTVFYNPVQVQNRDLSLLMIGLYAERRAIRHAVQVERKRLKKENLTSQQLDEQLNEYKEALDLLEVLRLQRESSGEDPSTPRQEGLTILDALAASGLRSLRYWKELEGLVNHVTINDLDAAAVERAHTNVQLNELEAVKIVDSNDREDPRPYGIRIQQGDATHELYNSRQPPASSRGGPPTTPSSAHQKPQWDVIDLDPYGSAAPFVDGAIQAIADGGLLCITCTDMAALGGSHPETCFGRYASMPIPRAGYLQEMAVRILLGTLATTAARYGRTIRPVLSVGMDFYIRVFVEVNNDKAGVNQLSLQLGHVYQSTQCPSFVVEPMGRMGGKTNKAHQPGRVTVGSCEETGAALKVGGPFWLGPMHDVDVVRLGLQRLKTHSKNQPDMKWIATRDRLVGLLTSCAEELPEAPLFYKLPDLTQAVHLSSMPLVKMKAALIHAGYQVSGYHKEPQAIKTDAPNRVVWDVVRAWAKLNPSKQAPKQNSAAAKILAVEPKIEVNFSVPSDLAKQHGRGGRGGVKRFPQNPQPHWGPKSKASGHKRKADQQVEEEPTAKVPPS